MSAKLFLKPTYVVKMTEKQGRGLSCVSMIEDRMMREMKITGENYDGGDDIEQEDEVW